LRLNFIRVPVKRPPCGDSKPVIGMLEHQHPFTNRLKRGKALSWPLTTVLHRPE
jgi:hypothetical protein